MSFLLRRSLRLVFFTFLVFIFLVVLTTIIMWWTYARELPNYEKLAHYQPPITTTVYASDGQIIGEFAKQRRIFAPFDFIPQKLVQAFLAAEDKNFYEHGAVDISGIMRAVVANVFNYIHHKRYVGASTITQQVAKNFFLTNKVSLGRKMKEAILAFRLENAYTKNKIMELYLNEIYLGSGSYGVATAALTYFNKPLNKLSLAEMAYLASLPKGPNNYRPVSQKTRAIHRRNWVIKRMYEDGFITYQQMKKAQKEDLVARESYQMSASYGAEYFVSTIRKKIFERYGEQKLYMQGLAIRTTIDMHMQRWAHQSLMWGLSRYDRLVGFRGPVAHIEHMSSLTNEQVVRKLENITMLDDLFSWKMAVVTKVRDESADISLRPEKDSLGIFKDSVPDIRHGTIELKYMTWAGKPLPMDEKQNLRKTHVSKVSDVLSEGDVVYVAPVQNGISRAYKLRQIPKVQGAIVVIDPHTGRLLAMDGGFNFEISQFNRATQAFRQPGSSFKPFVYANALDHGYTPATLVSDMPLIIDQSGINRVWRPKDYSNRFHLNITLRKALESSSNLATIRVSQSLGIKNVIKYAKKFDVVGQVQPVPSIALGAAETTLLKITYGYSIFDNDGVMTHLTMIDRVQDRFGKTVFKSDDRPCRRCNETFHQQNPPILNRIGREVISPQTAYQITSMLKGVVDSGTGWRARINGYAVAGKTGTSNEQKDAWFIGYSPDLVVGVYVGFDLPKPLGNNSTGSFVSAPIFHKFMTRALTQKPSVPFRMPSGLQLIKIDKKTGMLAAPFDKNVIFEVFKDGTGPNKRQNEEATHNYYDIGGIY